MLSIATKTYCSIATKSGYKFDGDEPKTTGRRRGGSRIFSGGGGGGGGGGQAKF